MARLKVIDPHEATGKLKELFDGVQNKLGSIPNLFKGMANSVVTLETYLTMGQILSKSELTAQEREVVALVCSTVNECNYCAAAHSAIATMLGVSPEDVLDIRKGKSGDSKIRALISFTQSVLDTKGFVPDSQIEAMKSAGYEDAHISEVIAVIAQNFFTNYFNHVNDTEVDFPEVPKV